MDERAEEKDTPARNSATAQEIRRIREHRRATSEAVDEQPEQPAAATEGRPASRSGFWRRRWGWIVGGLVALVAVAFGLAWWLPVCTVSTIEVTGNAEIATDDIVAATGLTQGMNLLRIDTGDAARGVASLPRVREATVSRRVPDTVHVAVTERRVVAWLATADAPVLVDDRGDTFVDGEPPAGAVRVEGVDAAQDAMLADLAAVVSAIPASSLSRIDHVNAADSTNFVFYSTTGSTVEWGANTDNTNKAVALDIVLSQPAATWNISDPSLVTASEPVQVEAVPDSQ